ncbi:MAG: S-adenosylmethionine:tRNA ribosyltransferase-isomerase [bacterium]|nr:S-adenosylmethionine:tRNA ribosyltransferase-isomerase [bacterium]
MKAPDPSAGTADEYDFALPDHLIAAYPPEQRGDSRLLVVQPGRTPGQPLLQDLMFRDLPQLLRSGDLLITNNTRVSHRRVRLMRATGGRIEALFLEPATNSPETVPPDTGQKPGETGTAWLCLIRGLKKLRPGEILTPPQTGDAAAGPTTEIGFEFLAARPDGKALLRPVSAPGPAPDRERPAAWTEPGQAEAFFASYGEVPIPPYLGRSSEDLDRQRYQTVYAQNPASVAAPTAGLHFTDTIIEEITQKGAEFASLELQIGYGTFAPLTDEQFRTNRLHTERYALPPELAERLNSSDPGRRLAVGTTTLRALEANRRAFHREGGNASPYRPGSYDADLFLRPPDRIETVDALITNFHLPGSSLVMLVACMLDRDDLMAAYRHAIQREYRFFSYGDAMLVCGAAFCS